MKERMNAGCCTFEACIISCTIECFLNVCVQKHILLVTVNHMRVCRHVGNVRSERIHGSNATPLLKLLSQQPSFSLSASWAARVWAPFVH